MRRQFAILVSLLAMVVASCTDQPSPTSPPRKLLAAISDGAHSGGNPDFFFLPPLVANPVGNPNFKAGTFNPHLLPVVRVFLLPTNGAAGCSLLGTPVYGPVAATLDAGSEQYQVNWDTRASNLADGAYYRVCVFSSPTGRELGFLDVAPVAGGMKKLATNDTYAFQDGRTLPIKVRIQQGALCANPQDCTEFTVSPAGGDFTLPSGFAGLSVPAGAVRPGDIVTVVIEKETPQFTGKCLPTELVQSNGCYHFSSEPALYQFAILVRMEACVDAQFLDEAQLAALRLFKYNTTQGLVELPQATPTLIDCTSFIALAKPEASPPTSFAAAALRGLGRWAGRLLSPPPLYASMPGGVPTGLGGMGGSFSDVGGAVPAEAQTIGFEQPTSPAVYGSTFAVAPTASSELPVTVVATGGCSIAEGTVTMTSGTTACVLTASQAGNASYAPAPDVVRTVAASKATQATVTLTVPEGGTVGQLGLVAIAGGGSGTGAISYASSTLPVCTVNAGTGSITLITAGTCSLTATRDADANYLAATSAPQAFSVTSSSPSPFPAPVVRYDGSQIELRDGVSYRTHYFTITNAADYAPDLFVPSPNLPPCGSNTDASRTWVDIYDNASGTMQRVYGYCALSDLSMQLWFAGTMSQTETMFRIDLTDRLLNRVVSTNVTIPSP